MLTIKRLYLYGVLAVALVLLLWGLTDLSRFTLDELARAFERMPAFSGDLAGEELSRAVALVLVGGTIVGVQLALVRRSLRGTPDHVADERASVSRSTYFFLVFAGTSLVLFWALVSLTSGLISSVVFGERGADIIGPLGPAIVVGVAWLLHLLARARDLRMAPQRTAGDWSTRLYLYGALFLTFLVLAVEAGDALTTVAREVLDLRPAWDANRWWQDAITPAMSAVIVASVGWLTYWLLGEHLRRAPEPMGTAHRIARTRRGYFLTVALTAAAAVLVLASMSAREALGSALGATASTSGNRVLEDVGGPLLMTIPFVLAWWWHLRRGRHEALVIDGPRGARSARRAGRLTVSFVGLVGLVIGLAWELQVLVDMIGSSAPAGIVTSAAFDVEGSGALGLALVGLVLWAPAWALLQQDRAHFSLEAATATSRRAYLMLVCGLSVVALMGSLAFLVWQATRLLMDTGDPSDSSWAVAILLVSAVVLAYHLWQLRSDMRLASTVGVGEEQDGPLTSGSVSTRALETIEISAPAGADFRVLNAAIRSELPSGYEFRLLTTRGVGIPGTSGAIGPDLGPDTP